MHKLKTFQTTLNATDAKLVVIIETAAQNGKEMSASDDRIELSGVKQTSSTGRSHSSNSAGSENGNGIQVEMVITKYGPELASINHKELQKYCKRLLQRADEYVQLNALIEYIVMQAKLLA